MGGKPKPKRTEFETTGEVVKAATQVTVIKLTIEYQCDVEYLSEILDFLRERGTARILHTEAVVRKTESV